MLYDKFHAAALGFYGMKEYIEFIDDKWLIGKDYKMGSLSDFIKFKTETGSTPALLDDCQAPVESTASVVSTESVALADSEDDSVAKSDYVLTTYPFKYSFNRDLNIFCASTAVLILALLIAVVLKS